MAKELQGVGRTVGELHGRLARLEGQVAAVTVTRERGYEGQAPYQVSANLEGVRRRKAMGGHLSPKLVCAAITGHRRAGEFDQARQVLIEAEAVIPGIRVSPYIVTAMRVVQRMGRRHGDVQ